jgi:hypothetical protein
MNAYFTGTRASVLPAIQHYGRGRGVRGLIDVTHSPGSKVAGSPIMRELCADHDVNGNSAPDSIKQLAKQRSIQAINNSAFCWEESHGGDSVARIPRTPAGVRI